MATVLILKICLEEIDRCRPFFIGIIAEKYGWIPLKSEIGQYSSLTKRFSQIDQNLTEGKSITEIEILYGVLYHHLNISMKDRINCGFFIRSKQLTDQLAQKYPTVSYYEDTEDKRMKLTQLKNFIETLNYPRLEYHSIEMLGEAVYEQILNALNYYFSQITIDTQDIQYQHDLYAKHLLFCYQPNQKILDLLNQFLENSQKSDDQKKNLVLIGASGIGKSSALAYWIDQTQKKNQCQHMNPCYLIQYYASADSGHQPLHVLNYLYVSVKNILKKIEHSLNISDQDQIKDLSNEKYQSTDQIQLLINLLMLEISKLPKTSILVIIIDGINQIQSKDLDWLPIFSKQVVCIVSSTSSKQVDELRSRGNNQYEIIEMTSLDHSDCFNLIQKYLGRYGKKLSYQQINQLMQMPLSNQPLFLTTLLSELNLFGVFELLDEQIANFSKISTIEELFQIVLKRLENDFGEDLCCKIFSFLFAAKVGLKEDELIEILDISRLKITAILLAMDLHLFSYQAILSFKHEFLRKFVYERYIKENQNLMNIQNQLLSFFKKEEIDFERKIQELPILLKNTNLLSDLVHFLKRVDVFQKMYEYNRYELKHYWMFVQKIEDLKTFYLNLLYQFGIDFEKDLSITHDSNKIKLIEQICDFLSFMDQEHFFEIQHRLISIRRWLLKIKENRLDIHQIELINASNQLALTLGQASSSLYGNKEKNDWKQESEMMFKSVIAQREKLLGKFHIDTLSSIDHLGSLLMFHQEYQKAKPFIELSLEGRIETLGLTHYDTVMSLNNAGALFLHLHDISLAEKYCSQAFEASKKVFIGMNHIEILNIIMGLMHIYGILGKHYLVNDLYLQAVEIAKNILSQDHPLYQRLVNDDC